MKKLIFPLRSHPPDYRICIYRSEYRRTGKLQTTILSNLMVGTHQVSLAV